MKIKNWNINKMIALGSLKSLVFLTVGLTFLVYLIFLIYGIPLAYVPENVSTIEFISYNVLAIIVETTLALFLFMHMLVKSKIDFQINK